MRDLRVSNDTVYWSIITILIFSIVCAYNLGIKDGINKEKIEWLEQKELDNVQR